MENEDGRSGPEVDYGWTARAREYPSPSGTRGLREVGNPNDHPLYDANPASSPIKPSAVSSPAKRVSAADDPLLGSDDEAQNPLSTWKKGDDDDLSTGPVTIRGRRFLLPNGGVEWKGKKAGVLSKYKTSDRMVITATFMKETGQRVDTKANDKVAQRLEELEEKSEQEQDMELSQQDYVNHIETLHSELANAWETEQRVKSLKIAIQCAKLLSDTNVIKFYPSKWVLVTEILDTFGELVYQRIKQRSFTPVGGGPPTALPDDFVLDDVNDEARETCRNWFFKIASIRELLPRMYVEMSILRCYRFLITPDQLKAIVDRLCAMIRGVGDLLVATCVRAFLARVVQRWDPSLTDHLTTSFYDHLHTMSLLEQVSEPARGGSASSVAGSSKMSAVLTRHRLSLGDYFDLFSPAIDWLIECLANRATPGLLNAVLSKYRDSNDGLILNHVLNNFSPSLLSPEARKLTELVAQARDDTFPKHRLYASLGANLVLCPPPDPAVRAAVLDTIWSAVNALDNTSPEDYLAVAIIFLKYTAEHFKPRQVNGVLGDILRHVKTDDRAYERLQRQLNEVVESVLNAYTDMGLIFSLDNFMPLMDLFQGSSSLDVSLSVLNHWERHGFATSDPLIIGLLMSLATNVHDSINSLSSNDDIRRVSRLIAAFMRQVQFGRDVEKQMNFYVDCRRAFSNIDSIKHQLVLGVASLAMKTHRIIRGQHTKKSSAFVRACIAFCYITVPSMEDALTRLHLYALVAQIALSNQSVHQAEALLRAAIIIIPEVPPILNLNDDSTVSSQASSASTLSTSPSSSSSTSSTSSSSSSSSVLSSSSLLCVAIANLCSTLVAMPGDPEHGPFVLQDELVQAIREYPWERDSTGRAEACLSLLSHFATASQPELPVLFRVPRVETNAYLFGGDDSYQVEIRRFTNQLLAIIFEDLNSLGQSKDANAPARRAQIAASLFDLTVSLSTLDPACLKVAHQMIELARANLPNQVNNTLAYIKARPDAIAQRYF